MAQFTVYKSTDASAPTMTGQADKLCALLQACLVDGYGAKSAAGWTVAYDGTNKTAFRQGAGSMFYLRVQDDGPGAGTFKEARILGYETMSDVDTGTGLFPTAAQFANGLFARKSTTADATARDWIVAADSRTVYVFIKSEVAVGAAGDWLGFMFGDFYSVVPSESYNCMIVGRITENSNASGAESMDYSSSNALVTGTGRGSYVARSYLGLGTAILVGKVGNISVGGQVSTTFGGALAFPNPSDGGIYLSRISLADIATAPTPNIRGWMRGFYAFLHAGSNVKTGDSVSGTGDLAGRAFTFISPSQGTVAYTIETSNTVDTN